MSRLSKAGGNSHSSRVDLGRFLGGDKSRIIEEARGANWVGLPGCGP